MNALFMPELAPPQVSHEAEIEVLTAVLEHGLTKIGLRGFQIVEGDHGPLAGYLMELGDRIADQDVISWYAAMLKIGAGLSMLAYRKTGYFQQVDDDALSRGKCEAEEIGIPEAFAIAQHLDFTLQDLLASVGEQPELQQETSQFRAARYSVDTRSFGAGAPQLLGIGAGCVRLFLQKSL